MYKWRYVETCLRIQRSAGGKCEPITVPGTADTHTEISQGEIESTSDNEQDRRRRGEREREDVKVMHV